MKFWQMIKQFNEIRLTTRLIMSHTNQRVYIKKMSIIYVNFFLNLCFNTPVTLVS